VREVNRLCLPLCYSLLITSDYSIQIFSQCYLSSFPSFSGQPEKSATLTSLDRPKQVMSGNDWHFRAACAGFVKCAFKLVDGWENVQQEGEDALNDEEVSFYAGDVS